MKVSIDCWEGVTTRDEEVEATRFEVVEAFVRRLDQERYTLVCLGESDAPCLIVGGGKGDYVVTATLDGEDWRTLAMGPREGPRRLVTGGGQPGDFHSQVVVTLEQALAAARTFFQRGALDETMTWITYRG